jgi:hypothetical protein
MSTDQITDLIFFKAEDDKAFEIFSLEKTTDSYEILKKETVDQIDVLKKYFNRNNLCWPDFSESLFTVVITSKCLKEIIEDVFPNRKVVFFYADEYIDCHGNIKKSLSEPEMNRVLKQVYASNPKKILIHLLNGAKNPVHEKMFLNVLKVAGYKVFLSEDCLAR